MMSGAIFPASQEQRREYENDRAGGVAPSVRQHTLRAALFGEDSRGGQRKSLRVIPQGQSR